MIFYFSGTGNSYYAASKVAEYTSEQVISIPEEMRQGQDSYEYSLQEEEIIGIVYPIHAWGPPLMVRNFIRKLSFVNYRNNYIFSIATCGANTGNAMTLLEKDLDARGLALKSAFSLVMPNNYMIMGDVDSQETAQKKLNMAEEQLAEISEIVAGRKPGVFRLTKGVFPSLLTAAINPLFAKYALDAGKFYATDACTGCGLCEKVCLMENISVEGKPAWGRNCTQCLACINICPEKAIQYGQGTIKKGRYFNPNYVK